jgi:hypothetical protein
MIRSEIHKHMEVIGSCGKKLGSVDHVVGRLINLAKADSADGNEHYIPIAWIERIDQRIYLNKNCFEVIQQRNGAAEDFENGIRSENGKNHAQDQSTAPGVTPNNDVRLSDDTTV